MPGRTTTDPKESTLKLRLNDTMRSYIEQKANSGELSMSEYIRELIREDMKNSSIGKKE